jgi:hypothetical protein
MRKATALELLGAAGPTLQDALSTSIAVAEDDAAAEEVRVRAREATALIVGNVARAVESLKDEGEKVLAERTLVLLLWTGAEEVRLGAEQCLRDLSPLDDDEATATAVDALAEWPMGSCVMLLNAVRVDRLNDNAPAGLGHLAARLWRESVSSDPSVDDGLADPPLAALSELLEAGAGVEPQPLLSEMEPSFADGVSNSAQADVRDEMVGLALQFVSAHLVTGGELARMVLVGTAASLRGDVQMGQESAVESHVRASIARHTAEAHAEVLGELLEAAEACSWLGSPNHEVLMMTTARALIGAGGSPDSPLSEDQVTSLTEINAEGFGEGLSVWLEYYADDPAGVYKIVAPILDEPLPSPVIAGLEGYRGRVSATHVAELCRVSVQRPLSVRLRDGLLDELGLADADDEIVTEWLIEPFGAHLTQPEGEELLRRWESLEPTHAGARRRLILEVFLPYASRGALAFDAAVRHLELCSKPPRGTKERIKEGMTAAIPSRDRKSRAKRLERRMEQVGLQRRGWLSRLLG